MPSRKEPALRWDGRWRVRWTDADGQRRSVSFGTDEKRAIADYRRWIARWRSDAATRTPPDELAPTIREAWARYREFASAYYRRADGTETQEPTIIAYAMRPVLDLFGGRRADAFTPSDLRTVQERWIREGKCSTTVNAWSHKIRRVWRWFVAEGLVGADVVESLRCLSPVKPGRFGAKPGRKIEPVELSDVERTIAHLPASLVAMVRLQTLTGMRPGEVCSMRPCDIHSRKDGLWVYQPPQHKTAHRGKLREVVLGPQAQAILTPYMTREVALPCFRPSDAEKERAAARVASYTPPPGVADYRRWDSYRKRAEERGERPRGPDGWTTGTYGRAIADAARKAGVARWSPNQIRHTVATRIREKWGLEAAQVVLGHSRADVTQIYAERNKRLAEDLARQA